MTTPLAQLRPAYLLGLAQFRAAYSPSLPSPAGSDVVYHSPDNVLVYHSTDNVSMYHVVDNVTVHIDIPATTV